MSTSHYNYWGCFWSRVKASIKGPERPLPRQIYIVEEGLKQKAHNCGRGTTQICVRENGDVSPCLQFNFVYGNLVNQDVDQIFNYQRVKVFNSIIEPNLETCTDCPSLTSCRGCIANAYNFEACTCKWKQVYPEEIKKLKRISIA